MQIPYTPLGKRRDGSTAYFPLIIVEFIVPPGIPSTKALADSGADRSLFDIELLERVGINIKNYPQSVAHGAAGISFTTWEFPIDVRFPQLSKKRIRLQASWRSMRDPKTNQIIALNLLGREDFFRQFQVLFSERKKLMDIYPYKS